MANHVSPGRCGQFLEQRVAALIPIVRVPIDGVRSVVQPRRHVVEQTRGLRHRAGRGQLLLVLHPESCEVLRGVLAVRCAEAFAKKALIVLSVTPASTPCDSLFSVGKGLEENLTAAHLSEALFHRGNGDVTRIYGGRVPARFPRCLEEPDDIEDDDEKGHADAFVGCSASRRELKEWFERSLFEHSTL